MNSAEKTVTLLKLLGQKPYVHGVTELGEKIECTKSGTYKLLSALVQGGLAAQTSGHKYTLGPAVYLLGKSYEEHVGLSKMIKPFLTRLRDLTGENVSFSTWINGKVVLVYREESTQLIRVAGKAGQERPLHAGATGKVLTAHLPEEEIRRRLMEEPLEPFTPLTITDPEALLEEYRNIREQGYAISDGELHIETMGVGAPIRNEAGEVWAAISIGAPRMRVDEVKKQRYIFLVKETAREISEALGQSRPDNVY